MTGEQLKQEIEDLGLLDGLPFYEWYLPFLGINYSEAHLYRMRRFAIRVKDSPEFVRDLIREKNWRPVLIGTVLIVLLRDTQFQEDMVWRINHGNWVAPQLAAAIAIIDKGNGESMLREIVEKANLESNAKSVMSAYSGLKLLGSRFADAFSQSPLYSFLKEKDSYDGSEGIAVSWWEHWSEVAPV